MSKRSLLTHALATAFALLAIAAASLNAEAQTTDDGELEEGDVGKAPNTDSEAVPGLGMELPDYGGSGCPQGSISAILSPDQRTLSVLFDAYVARAGGDTGQPRSALNCKLKIPFNVPAGYRVQVVKMDYRGFISVPLGANAVFSASVHYLEKDGRPTKTPKFRRGKIFKGPRQEEVMLTSFLRGQHWSPCGQSFVLMAESRLAVNTNPSHDDALSAIDSMDAVQKPVRYSLRWQKCNAERPERPERPGRRNLGGRPIIR